MPANVRETLTIIGEMHTVLKRRFAKSRPPSSRQKKGAYQTMIVKRADFITSMKDYGDFATKGCPEVAFAGKSNVGKSSMIIKLTNRNKLTWTVRQARRGSSTSIRSTMRSISLIAGYGFTKVSRTKSSPGQDDAGLFCPDGDLCHVFHLVDIRHEPSAEDKEMGMFLRQARIPFTVVATKADKISRGALSVKYLADLPRAAGSAVAGDSVLLGGRHGQGRDAF